MNEAKKRGRKGVLSAAIDPLLFEGGRTVREMSVLLSEQVFLDKNGKEFKADVPTLINNIRSRMFVLVDKGYVLEKTGRQVKFVQPTPAAPETPVNA
jgi:hypothetical protein